MKVLRNLHPAWIATAIAVAIILWMASGSFGEGDSASKPTEQTETKGESGMVQVEVRVSHAQPITRTANVSGRTAPVRSVTVRAETAGRVTRIGSERGESIDNNAVIARLSPDDRPAQLRQTKALREQRRLQYQAAEQLQEKGYQTKLDLAQAKANMEQAEAQVEEIQEDINNTVIRAPFAGILETRPVEEGDYVSVGDEIGRVIDQDPFIVTGNVSEDVIGFLETGQAGSVTLVNGQTKQGTLRYIATDADPQTLTYLVELLVPNPEGRLISGASAQMRLPLEQAMAHEVEPAILTLNAAGDFGINSVDDDNRVQFNLADIVRNEDGKVWLAGLPEALRIITVGQGFVTAGDKVKVTREDSDAAESPAPVGAETQAPTTTQ